MLMTPSQRWRRFRNWQFVIGLSSLVGFALAFFAVSNAEARRWTSLVAAALFGVFWLLQLVRIVKYFSDPEFWAASRRSSGVELILGRVATVVLILVILTFLVMVSLGRFH